MLDQLSDRVVLVTGSTGFIGSRLVEKLLGLGAVVVSLARFTYRRQEQPTKEPQERLYLLSCDLVNLDSLSRCQEVLQKVEFVVHLAGFVLKSSEPSGNDMDQSFQANIIGTANLLNLLSGRVKGICYASTLDVYGQPLYLPIAEDHPTNPESFYGISKLAAEMTIKVYCRRAGIPATILRYSQVYGPGDTSKKLIPSVIERILRSEPFTIYDTGSDVRDYVYIDDVVGATLEALCRNTGGIYNVATGQGYTIRQVAQKVVDLCGAPENLLRCTPSDRAPTKVILDISRAERYLGYQPKVTLEEGLAKQIEWHRRNLAATAG